MKAKQPPAFFQLPRNRHQESDEQVVDRARRAVVYQRKARWLMLGYAAFFLGFCGYATVVCIRNVEGLNPEELQIGFLRGLALSAVFWSFGLAGALCLGKFLSGFQNDFRLQELLVNYHDRLRDLGQLPDEKKNENEGSL